MLPSMLVGMLFSMVTIAIHALGTSAWIQWLRRRENQFRSPRGEIYVLSFTAVVLLMIHTAEVALWAVAYLVFIGGEQFSTMEKAVYFSTVTFTSLGYGDVVIVGTWRMLSAVQAMVGIFAFGWSTALLFAIVQRIWRDKLADRQ